ncbi:MAG: ATP-dependent helicase HrpB [Candidatus Cryptobacteroides sp.]
MNWRTDFSWDSLPVMQIVPQVNGSLRKNPLLVVTASPGAGKSTCLPLAVAAEFCGEGKVIVLEPRRIAAMQIAERMAWMLGEKTGQTVGYRVRLESKVSADTKIEVITEGILTRMLVEDPTLDGVAVVMFDEFHERSLSADLSLALTREAFRTIRPDLRIVIMSATMDTDSICRNLGASLLESDGRMYPVEVVHSERDTDEFSCAEDVAKAVRTLHREHEGDILAFLPGEGEIRRCAELLGKSLGKTAVYPLYGMLSSDDQKKAIAPSAPGKRKVVLATPIAETSITIEGVRVVVDSGLYRKMAFNPQNGLDCLETVRISMDMARQRTGRAGRNAPGICLRLWTPGTELRMDENRTPEIMEADLCQAVLDIAAWGGEKIGNLQWLTPPPPKHVRQAFRVLENIGAVSDKGQITGYGRRIASLPCHPRIAAMLVGAGTPVLKALASDIAAILDERDPLSADEVGADLCLRVERLRHLRATGTLHRRWIRIAAISAQYRSLTNAPADNSSVDPYEAGMLIASAYPERVAQSRGYGHFLLSGGDIAMTGISDPLADSDYLAVAVMNAREGGEGRIFLASPVCPDDLKTVSKDVTVWDSKAGKVIARKERRIGRILVDSQSLPDVRREDVVEAICEAAPKDGAGMFDFSDNVGNLQRRVASVSSWHPELEFPDLNTENVLRNVREWLPLYIGKAATAAELKKIDMEQVLWGMLDFNQQNAVERLAPSHIEVPTGSRIRVEYRHGADAPVLRVRLQECFGMRETPKVDGGRRPVLMELLSPGFKPVQLTTDLESFWKGTYFEVRKELRMRYPKHLWPENPLETQPVRGVAKRR